MDKEFIRDRSGAIVWEIIWPSEVEERFVSDVIESKDGSVLPYNKLRCGEWIIEGYAKKYMRAKYRDYDLDRKRRASWRK